jgi:nicotinamide mononucleotide transporter
LQVIYIALGLQGWYYWLYGGQNRTALRVAHASRRMLAVTGGIVVVGTIGLTWILRSVKGSAPVLDGLTTVLSLAAQYLLNRKAIENWYFWILADVLYIYLYITRHLELTAVLYFIFLCLCIAGLMQWRQSLAEQAPLVQSDPANQLAEGQTASALNSGGK